MIPGTRAMTHYGSFTSVAFLWQNFNGTFLDLVTVFFFLPHGLEKLHYTAVTIAILDDAARYIIQQLLFKLMSVFF